MSSQLTYQKFIQNRQVLGKILPLDMPLSIQIQVTNLCNFKCYYCITSQSLEKRREAGLLLQHMPLEDYLRCIDSIAKAGGVKVLNLVGWGEPLLHPDIVNMVQYAKKKLPYSLVRIVTNGSLLTHDLSDKLIEAGLDNLRVSVQGVSEQEYKDYSNIEIDFSGFLENLKYFYDHRKRSTISLKIMDVAVKDKEDKFLNIFPPICDEYMVDSLTETNNLINFHGHGSNLDKTFLGGDFVDTSICSTSFFRGFIDVDSQLFACCHLPVKYKFGDVRNNFFDVWNGKSHIQFLLNMLRNGIDSFPGCSGCKMYLNQMLSTDRLDDYRDDLICKYQFLLENSK